MEYRKGDDGLQAVKAFELHKDEVRCILLDLTMPRMDGIEALRALRDIREGVPVILCSGFSEQEIADKLEGGEVAAFLAKPYVFSEVLAQIREVLESPPLTRNPAGK